MHIIFIQTGGTIDKDYPHTTKGWAFEFGDEPATKRLLERISNPSFTYDIITVCQKDSLEINDVEFLLASYGVTGAGYPLQPGLQPSGDAFWYSGRPPYR